MTPEEALIQAQQALHTLYNTFTENQSENAEPVSCIPVPKCSYLTLVETEMEDEYYAFFMVMAVEKDTVEIAWFFDAGDNPDEGIPLHVLRRAPQSARNGFWFSNVKEKWTVKHFQEVAVRPIVNISWPCTGWDDNVEINVTAFYNPSMQRASDKVSLTTMPGS